MIAKRNLVYRMEVLTEKKWSSKQWKWNGQLQLRVPDLFVLRKKKLCGCVYRYNIATGHGFAIVHEFDEFWADQRSAMLEEGPVEPSSASGIYSYFPGVYIYKWKNHFYEMKGDVGMSVHEKERKQEDTYTKTQSHS